MIAVRNAIDLLLVPSRVRQLRAQPLPDDVVILLRIAAGDIEAETAAATSVDRSRDVIKRSATFFIEQILFAPHADSYRVLGADPQASAAELRRNVALLLRWLHPDLDHKGERSTFVGRVTAAWNDVKTTERRVAYDEARRLSNGSGSQAKAGRSRTDRPKEAPIGRHRRGRLIRRRSTQGFFTRALSAVFHPTSRQ